MLMFLLSMGCTPAMDPSSSDAAHDPEDCSWQAPENTWEQSTPPDCLEAQGLEEGQVVPDMRLVDQHGDTVSLWQFYGDLILLDFSTMWGAQMWPEEIAVIGAEYADAGLMPVSVLFEDVYGEVPDAESLQYWAELTGVQGPVLADDADYASMLGVDVAWPRLLLIDQDLTVVEENIPWHQQDMIRLSIEAHL